MDHPLTLDTSLEVRKRVIQLFKDCYKIRRASNIIFVCGGNDDHQMRPRFVEYCKAELSEYVVFLPEYAMSIIAEDGGEGQFDLADFEELVAKLAHAVVVFPEAPGSYAETGYFSAIQNIAAKCVLVLDGSFIQDSFISLGPAKKIAASSAYFPNIVLSYDDPNFEAVKERIVRRQGFKNHRRLEVKSFNEMTMFELAGIILKIVELLIFATFDDVSRILSSIFQARYSKGTAANIISILAGAKFITRIGSYGHFCVTSSKRILQLRDGRIDREKEVRFEIAGLFDPEDDEIQSLIVEARDAA